MPETPKPAGKRIHVGPGAPGKKPSFLGKINPLATAKRQTITAGVGAGLTAAMVGGHLVREHYRWKHEGERGKQKHAENARALLEMLKEAGRRS
jgi:hypothetical protein